VTIREQFTIRRVPDVDHLEMMDAVLVSHVYGRHAHDSLSIGIVDQGRGAFWCQGAIHLAGPGSLTLIGPGQAHTGYLVSGTAVRYRMLYLEARLVAAVYGAELSALRLIRHVASDAEAVRAVQRICNGIESAASRLEREQAVLTLLELLEGRHLCFGSDGDTGREPRAVRMIKAYLESHLRENVSLEALAALVDLHPAYLNRTFRRSVGLPPHAYQTHLRIERAKALLAEGRTPSATAYLVGFVDQSHLSRHFRAALGVTPARYRREMSCSA